jgi:hypothetical protein
LKTLVFCTAWAETTADLDARVGRWLRHHQAIPWPCEVVIAVFADGLPEPVTWPAGDYFRANLYPHLGRPNHLSYPGWWRSFAYASRAARLAGCERIIHIESDFYICSWRMVDKLAELTSGWTAFWCARHGFPESAIQVIGPNRFSEIDSLWEQLSMTDFRGFDGCHAEWSLPFDRIVREMTGDRYGELGKEPRSIPGIDWYGQLTPDLKPPVFEVAKGRELVS